jgi:hypothetical protein
MNRFLPAAFLSAVVPLSSATAQDALPASGAGTTIETILIVVPVALLFVGLLWLVSRATTGKTTSETVNVSNKEALVAEVQRRAIAGYQSVVDRGNVVIMNRKVPVNWLLLILLLFIPVIGWAALLVLLFSNRNKFHTVTITVVEA